MPRKSILSVLRMFNLFVLALLAFSVVQSQSYDDNDVERYKDIIEKLKAAKHTGSSYVCCNQPPTYSPPSRPRLSKSSRGKRDFNSVVARILAAGRDTNAVAEVDPALEQELNAKVSFLRAIQRAAALRDYLKGGAAAEALSSPNTPDDLDNLLTSPDVDSLPSIWNDKRTFVPNKSGKRAPGGVGGFNMREGRNSRNNEFYKALRELLQLIRMIQTLQPVVD